MCGAHEAGNRTQPYRACDRSSSVVAGTCVTAQDCSRQPGRKELGGSWMTKVLRMPASSERTALRETVSGFNIERVRDDFPILHSKVRGKAVVYLDNAAT